MDLSLVLLETQIKQIARLSDIKLKEEPVEDLAELIETYDPQQGVKRSNISFCNCI